MMPTDREIAEELADSIAAGSWTIESLEAIVTAARTDGAREMRERAKQAIVNVRFGAPSNWPRDGYPNGWHMRWPCKPEEAALHDNGCNDSFAAIAALTETSE